MLQNHDIHVILTLPFFITETLMAYREIQQALGHLCRIIVISCAAPWMLGSCSSIGAACQFDSECDAGNACIRDQCRLLCTSDEDCVGLKEGEVEEIACHAVPRQEGDEVDSASVCGPFSLTEPLESGSGDEICVEDDYCRRLLEDEGAVCSFVGRCVIPQQLDVVVIEDTAQGEELSQGAIILSVYVVFEEAIVAHGEIVEHLPPQDVEPAEDAMLRRPSMPVGPGECPTGEQEGLALGKGGSARLSFVDLQGRAVALERGWEVVVIERGQTCGEEETNDPYDASLCVYEVDEGFEHAVCDQAVSSDETGRATLQVAP